MERIYDFLSSYNWLFLIIKLVCVSFISTLASLFILTLATAIFTAIKTFFAHGFFGFVASFFGMFLIVSFFGIFIAFPQALIYGSTLAALSKFFPAFRHIGVWICVGAFAGSFLYFPFTRLHSFSIAFSWVGISGAIMFHYLWIARPQRRKHTEQPPQAMLLHWKTLDNHGDAMPAPPSPPTSHQP